MAATPVLKACVCGELNDRLLVHMLEVGLQGFQLHTSFIDPGWCRVYKHLCQGQCHRAKEAWDVFELFVELCNLDWLVPNVWLRCRCSNLWIISWDSQDLIKHHHSVLDYQTCDIDTVTPIGSRLEAQKEVCHVLLKPVTHTHQPQSHLRIGYSRGCETGSANMHLKTVTGCYRALQGTVILFEARFSA